MSFVARRARPVALCALAIAAAWANRERFFFEGMRLEIGPCFRDYAPPAFFTAATEKFRGQATLAEDGGLQHYGAGLPFAPDAIDPKIRRPACAGPGTSRSATSAPRMRGRHIEPMRRAGDVGGCALRAATPARPAHERALPRG